MWPAQCASLREGAKGLTGCAGAAPNSKRKVQWSTRGSGEATEGGTLKSLGLSGPSTDLEGQPDAGTLTLARMKSKVR